MLLAWCLAGCSFTESPSGNAANSDLAVEPLILGTADGGVEGYVYQPSTAVAGADGAQFLVSPDPVEDATPAPEGTLVMLVGDTAQSTTTDGSGRFAFPNCPAGRYGLRVGRGTPGDTTAPDAVDVRPARTAVFQLTLAPTAGDQRWPDPLMFTHDATMTLGGGMAMGHSKPDGSLGGIAIRLNAPAMRGDSGLRFGAGVLSPVAGQPVQFAPTRGSSLTCSVVGGATQRWLLVPRDRQGNVASGGWTLTEITPGTNGRAKGTIDGELVAVPFGVRRNAPTGDPLRVHVTGTFDLPLIVYPRQRPGAAATSCLPVPAFGMMDGSGGIPHMGNGSGSA
jgi:hypothetical protein